MVDINLHPHRVESRRSSDLNNIHSSRGSGFWTLEPSLPTPPPEYENKCTHTGMEGAHVHCPSPRNELVEHGVIELASTHHLGTSLGDLIKCNAYLARLHARRI